MRPPLPKHWPARLIATLLVCLACAPDPAAQQQPATPGVDVIFIGTGDLSFSFGLRGQQDHPRVEEAARAVLDAARRHGKIAGRPAGFLSPHGVRPARRQRPLY
jgi:hypothetical protein